MDKVLVLSSDIPTISGTFILTRRVNPVDGPNRLGASTPCLYPFPYLYPYFTCT